MRISERANVDDDASTQSKWLSSNATALLIKPPGWPISG